MAVVVHKTEDFSKIKISGAKGALESKVFRRTFYNDEELEKVINTISYARPGAIPHISISSDRKSIMYTSIQSTLVEQASKEYKVGAIEVVR